MNDQTITIELKPVIYAYHHGYRVVAKSHNVSPQVVDKLVLSNHHLYFTNRRQDEEIRPLKFRFFPLEVEANEQKEKCYVLARLEPRVSHSGLVSATQFYVIDGPNCKIFEDELHANAAFLMAKIPFLNFNLERLGRNEVANLSPTRLVLNAGAIDRQLQELPGNPILPELRALFTAEVIEALEKRQRIFVYSKKFTDPVAIFNLYCRVFFTAQLDCYRRQLSFSTAELTMDISGYDLVFLHTAADDEIASRRSNTRIISLDNAESGKTVLWYLNEEKLPQYHRLLSQRIVKPNFAAIANLKPYCNLLSNATAATSAELASRQQNVISFAEALNWGVIADDFLNVLADFKITPRALERLRLENIPEEILHKLGDMKDSAWQGKESFLRTIALAIGEEEATKLSPAILKNAIGLAAPATDNLAARAGVLRSVFEAFYQMASGSIPSEAWPGLLNESFNQLVIDWFEFLIKNRTAWPENASIIEKAIHDFSSSASNLKKEIVRKMLEENVGLGCVLNEMEIERPEAIFNVWLSLLAGCEKELKADLTENKLREVIWQKNIGSIIAKINLEKNTEMTFSLPLRTLCLKLSELYFQQTRSQNLFYEMLHTMMDMRLAKTVTTLFLEFVDTQGFQLEAYKGIFDNSPSKLEAFIVEQILQPLTKGNDKSAATDDRPREELVFKFITQLSILADRPNYFDASLKLEEIRRFFLENFIFTGKHPALPWQKHFRFLQAVESKVSTETWNIAGYRASFANETRIQHELLANLNLIENGDFRQMRVKGLSFALEIPQFAGGFARLPLPVKQVFFDNLDGFIEAAKNIPRLKQALLPALWSYLRRVPDDCAVNGDQCFEKMLDFIGKNTSGSKGFYANFEELCKDIETIPCLATTIRAKELSFLADDSGKIFIQKCDYENYLLQLAAATQNRRERIAMFLNSLVSRIGLAQVNGPINEIIRKYYLARLSDPNDQRKRIWEAEFNRLSKK